MKYFDLTLSFFKEAKFRNSLLFYVGFIFFITFLIFLIAFPFCNESLFQICHWLKPFKFSLSFAVYVFSIGWYLEYLKPNLGEKVIRKISLWFALLILLDMVVILLQSWQSSDSYENLHLSAETTAYLADAFHLLGNGAILINTLFVVYLTFCFFQPLNLNPTSYLLGIRASLVILLLSSFLGGILLVRYGQLPPDPYHLGLPFTQLNSTRGQLDTMHFLGVHYLQFLPICGYLFKGNLGITLVSLFSLAYVALFVILLINN